MVFMLLVGTALLATGPQEPVPTPASTSTSSSADPAVLAEYNTLKAEAPDTADGHWKLGLWCEQKGLKPEAEVEFLAVTQLDPRREPAWKKLGYQKEKGRWMSAKQAAEERAEAEVQRKADTHWRGLLDKWKGGLGQKSKRAEAEKLLAGVDDPRAIPSIWKVFARGGPDDQERAIDMLGHIKGEQASRALGGLAVFGKTALVRRAAVETLALRDPDAVLMAWIGLLRPPVKYEVRQVAGPGSPGALLVEGVRYNVRRFYAPPSLDQTQDMFIEPQMRRMVLPLQFNSNPPGPPPGSRVVGFVNNTNLLIYDDSWALPKAPKNGPDPTVAYQGAERLQLQAQINRDFEFDEATKMAVGAQMQLERDVNAVEAANATIRETNARVSEALHRVAGKDFGEDREAWLKWYMERRGYAYVPPAEQRKGTVDVQVPLPYVPQSGPAIVTGGGGGGGGGGGSGWCLIWEHEKGKPPKTGSCFAAGTPILTPDGPRTIESLRPGDRVLTGAGSRDSEHVGSILSRHQSDSPGPCDFG
ncbi:HEAT repeat domain-containing protein [Singulisphaera sp. GP187]|uniref:HEAT repeat domain-containing protein n=1 Tax=Singulisphaera sp. GP187 TaxID=1882752 RepID=UPI00094150EB|nr:HEAT repeat domain-containing protein [Singulisphaera sp. GP187]